MIEAEVTNAEIDIDDGFNKRIANMTLIGTTENSLEVKIHFQEPDDITSDILDPDELVIRIIRPELILDAETGDYLQLDSSYLEYKIDLTP